MLLTDNHFSRYMEKEYLKPVCTVVELRPQTVLCTSVDPFAEKPDYDF